RVVVRVEVVGVGVEAIGVIVHPVDRALVGVGGTDGVAGRHRRALRRRERLEEGVLAAGRVLAAGVLVVADGERPADLAAVAVEVGVVAGEVAADRGALLDRSARLRDGAGVLARGGEVVLRARREVGPVAARSGVAATPAAAGPGHAGVLGGGVAADLDRVPA